LAESHDHSSMCMAFSQPCFPRHCTWGVAPGYGVAGLQPEKLSASQKFDQVLLPRLTTPFRLLSLCCEFNIRLLKTGTKERNTAPAPIENNYFNNPTCLWLGAADMGSNTFNEKLLLINTQQWHSTMSQQTVHLSYRTYKFIAGKVVSALTICLLFAQTLCWFAFFYILFYYVPRYKKLHQDFDDHAVSNSWQFLVAMSDWVVIQTCTDSIFQACLLAFLIVMVALNISLGAPTFCSKSWIIWSIMAFIFSLCLLIFEVVTILTAANRLAMRHPEILDYGLW